MCYTNQVKCSSKTLFLGALASLGAVFRFQLNDLLLYNDRGSILGKP